MSAEDGRPCPHCARPMRAVQARARTGYLLVLDQCESCGGVWCDRWELFPLAASEAARLDPIDTQQLCSQNTAPAEPGRCPRCEIALHPFRDPMLPADARIERCRVCEGMWLNRGELTLAKRKAAALEKPHAAAVDGLARRYGEEARWTRVADVGAAMFPAEDEAPEDAAIGASTWVAAAWIALRALLHLALRP